MTSGRGNQQLSVVGGHRGLVLDVEAHEKTAHGTRRTYESLAEAAARTGVSVRTLRRRVAEGRLTAYRCGPRLLRVDTEEVDALMKPVPTT